ncbi:MAG: ATP phosphoribosyltransferase regulatory subunit [Porticoccaceae bacterium]|nr:ATP phosphoribosyltransferase regulatory subunit [Porticoccaceae bacterium]
MSKVDSWLLPDGIDEVLPEQARLIERARRELLDLYNSWGYDLVIPPMVEFTESLLSGFGADLDLMTFRLTDQLSGRMMGIRADITPQAARIDAHSLNRRGPNRLCYAGTVLQTKPRAPLESRTPISVGVELFGESGVSADIEVIELFLNTLEVAAIDDVHLDLGHVDILRGLLTDSNLSADQEAELFDLLQSKASTELDTWIINNISDSKLAKWLKSLPTLAGGTEVLTEAKQALAGAPKQVIDALGQLEKIVDALTVQNNQQVSIYLDLGDIPGYGYHTGVVFAAYKQGYGKALGNGGRYDNIGEAFGRARTATGFAFDLKSLVANGQFNQQSQGGIFVPQAADAECCEKITDLRQQGERVVQGFAGQLVDFQEINCDRQLIKKDGQYLIEKIS